MPVEMELARVMGRVFIITIIIIIIPQANYWNTTTGSKELQIISRAEEGSTTTPTFLFTPSAL